MIKNEKRKVIRSFRFHRCSDKRQTRYFRVSRVLWLPTKVVAEFHIWIQRRNRRVLNSRRFHRSTVTNPMADCLPTRRPGTSYAV